MRTLIVHNPRAGFGSDAIFEFQRRLLRAGDECTMRLLTPDPAADATALADARSFDLVVLSGGDGTVARALYALRSTGVPTCVFPSGTANLLAANIGNAAEPAALAAACRRGHTCDLDLGEMRWTDGSGQERVSGFALMAGTGYDAQLMHDAVPGKQLLGEAAYFAAALANPLPEVYTYTIEVDGRTYVRKGLACLVANNATIQADIEIVADCSMADGLLDVIVLEAKAASQLLAPIVAGLVDPKGRDVARPHVTSFKGSSVRVTSNRPTKMEIDGDVIGDDVTYWEARVLPGVARIVTDEMSRYA